MMFWEDRLVSWCKDHPRGMAWLLVMNTLTFILVLLQSIGVLS